MFISAYKNLKLRIWHFLFMPNNVSNVTSGKVELTNIVDRLSKADDYYLVYQYGKSGSSTVYDYFSRSGKCAIHCHHLNDKTLKIREYLAASIEVPKKVAGQRFLSNTRYRIYQQFLLNNNKPVKIFISLREPEGFLKSAYFQQWKLFSELSADKEGEVSFSSFTGLFNNSLNEIDAYIDKASNKEVIESLILSDELSLEARCILTLIYNYVYWFEVELFEVFNIDKKDIKAQGGYWSFNKESVKGSIIPVENFDESLTQSIDNLVMNNTNTEFKNKNVAQDKSNYEYYKHLKANAIIPNNIMKLMKSGYSYNNFYN